MKQRGHPERKQATKSKLYQLMASPWLHTTLATLKMSRFQNNLDTVEQELIKLSAKSNMNSK